ncbi:Polysaccharide ABC transporter, ATP-binding protein [Rhodopirellula maiorica SM1]|uniref:Polysaccharide ABC transporter, ATP-binding protein n=1 Tax=Rhodopirellula maiorica SM1 TaxID=1265738 RepID=M5RVA5_9BACT|nr:ATP-binding cassette domain-containing protein [Rhodopirellula maiorica]EMI17884.1 Polysaccharide ABC transporter, ATP-binding protein [Rhodopirellula maiorica SM1]
MSTAIKIENLSKRYKLGLTHAGSVRELVNRTASRLMGRSSKPSALSAEDPSRVDSDGMFWALRDIDLEIPTGEAIGIIGRNGAGKSTLLKVLSRITQPTAGRIELRGRVASLLEVGTGFHPELTGRENVYLNGTILGMTRTGIRKRFNEIVQFAGIEKFIDTPVKRYSSGMTVRLGFAVAAHLEPEILIVDEVLAVGDIEFQQRCLGKMDEVASSGRTVLFVSHNMATVRQLTERSVVLKQGSIAFLGPTEEAIDVYTANNRDVANDSGRRQMDGMGERVRLESIRFQKNDTFFEVDEPLIIDVVSRSLEYSGDARISLTMYRGDGAPVGSCFSRESVSLQANNTTKINLQLNDLRLAPGSYYFAISIGTGNHQTGFVDFDCVTDVLHFEVVRPVLDSGVVAIWHNSWGAIHLPTPIVTSRKSLESYQ